MSITERVDKFSKLDLLSQDDRYAMGVSIRRVVDGLWTFATTGTRANYLAIIFAVVLWLTPQNGEAEKRSKVRLLFNITASLVAAGFTYSASSSLERHQSDEDAENDLRQHQLAVQADLNKTELEDRSYVAKVSTRHQLNTQLPSAHQHPYLKSAEDAERERLAPAATPGTDKLAFIKAMGIEDHPEAEMFLAEGGVGVASAAGGAGGSVAATDPKRYSYKMIRKERKLCYDLRDDRKYCGLPIVDVSKSVARDNYSLLMIGPSGSGKTVLLEHCIKSTQEENALVDFFGVTHKGRNIAEGETLHYAGLEETKDFLEYSATDDDENRFISNGYELKRICNRLLSALHNGSKHKTVALIDEINNGHKATKRLKRIVKSRWDADKASTRRNDPKPPRPELLDIADDYSEATSFAFTQGQSKNFRLWMISHDNTNDALGMSHSEKLSARYLVLARDGQDSVFLRTFDDNRFIVDDETREQMKAKYLAFKKAHKKMRSPANIVVCLSNIGGKGWQLSILPQYGPVTQIEFAANNPHQNDLDGDGLPDFTADELDEPENTSSEEPEEPEEPEETPEEENEPMSIENSPANLSPEAIAALEKSLTARQPKAECDRAIALIQWLRNDGSVFVRASGDIDPAVIANRYPHVHSLEELEYLLEVAEQMGIGIFITEPLTDLKLWRFLESAPVPASREVFEGGVSAAVDYDDDVSTTVELGELPTVDQIFAADSRPEWMTDERLMYVRDLIMRNPTPGQYQKVRLLWKSSRFYKPSASTGARELSKEQFLLIVKILAHPNVGVIEMEDGDDTVYRVLPSDEDLS